MKKSDYKSPPKWADRLLEFYCKDEFIEEIQGDAHEIFDRMVSQGQRRAQWTYVWNIIRFFKPSNIKTIENVNSNYLITTMNNFKIAARVLWKQKIQTALNIASITIGMACFILLGLYVKHETSFDKFHEKGDRIYRTWSKEDYGDDKLFYYTNSPLPLAPALEANIPEVEATVQVDYNRRLVGKKTENRINERIAMVSPNFFDVFSFELIRGNKASPLSAGNQVVISEQFANKYFAGKEAVGQEMFIEMGESIEPFVVSAIVGNAPENTGFYTDIVISNVDRYDPRRYQAWFSVAPETFVLLRENSSQHRTEAKFPKMIEALLGERLDDMEYILGLQPLEDIHLNRDYPLANMPIGNINYVYVLGTVGVLVLIIACINYTILSTGQSIKRAKEVGIRKVVGAQRKGLIGQYLTESILISIIATMLGLILAHLLLSPFNFLVGTSFHIPQDPVSIIGFLGIALLVGCMAGTYPAFILSKTELTSVLRGATVGSKSAGWIRNTLLGFQLFLTFFLISSSLLINKQLDYLSEADKGFNDAAMVAVPLYAQPNSGGFIGQFSSAMDNGQLLQSALEQNHLLSHFGLGSHVFGAEGWLQLGFESKYDSFLEFNLLIVDSNYMDAFDMEMLQGTPFNSEISLHQNKGVILNESAVTYFGLDEPIGARLPGADFGEHVIIGVANDFNFENMRNEIKPLVIVQNPAPLFEGASDFNVTDNPIPKLVFKYNGSSLVEVASIIRPVWDELFPDQELNFNFVEQGIQLQYEEDAKVSKMASMATVISILIASFGLLGLTIFLVNAKMKEIGVRKILGASPRMILVLLMNHFILQLLLAFLISIPVTYYLMREWLNEFVYRTSIGLDPFLGSAGITLLVILAVIGYQSVKAYRVNAVLSLRNE